VPNLIKPQASGDTVEFVASVPLDLLNAMCFTALAGQLEGIPEWPSRTRQEMAPALRDELDFFFGFPGLEWGALGTLTDALILHREAWGSVEALLDFVRALPPGGDGTTANLGIQGLALAAPCFSPHFLEATRPALDARREIAAAAEDAGRDVAETLALFDDPEAVRTRLIRLIRRFYDEHYHADEARRVECMERTASARNGRPAGDIDALLRELTGRPISCIREEPGAYKTHIFVPSLDVGPYSSCADFPPVHGVFYQCEARFTGAEEDSDDARLALVYKALADEQRLRILRELREGELYAQEIVARTGFHQSVVSRHLSFLKAVGLVTARRQNNMKFFSLNRDMRAELSRAVDAFLPVPRMPFGSSKKTERRPARVE
jgi:DNA-binding transcriptional ArsR family regulator